MYLENLKIIEENGLEIRNVLFKSGLNIVVDHSEENIGNNVGKTTFLKLEPSTLNLSIAKFFGSGSKEITLPVLPTFLAA